MNFSLDALRKQTSDALLAKHEGTLGAIWARMDEVARAGERQITFKANEFGEATDDLMYYLHEAVGLKVVPSRNGDLLVYWGYVSFESTLIGRTNAALGDWTDYGT